MMQYLSFWAILTLLFLLPLSVNGATEPDKRKDIYPKDYFRPPVEGSIQLSGTFGELRSNHFHSGIDIKGYRGRKIVAIADGYIYRINVSAGGYGNSIYLKHPNGYISLYAHLDEFQPAIAEFVAQWQQENQQFEMDYFPDTTEFIIQKGQVIGKMGNTGYSFGPHLHFEIRKAANDLPVNPLHFGISIQDSQAPIMSQLRVYGLDEQRLTTSSTTLDLRSSDSHTYHTSKDTILIAAETAGVAIKTYDLMDGTRNWNGVYQIQLFVDGQIRHTFVADELGFDEWNYVHAHYDYADMLQYKSYFNRCFRLPGNHFSGYEMDPREGILQLSPQKAQKIKIVATDWHGNTSSVECWLKQSPGPAASRKQVFDYYLHSGQENQIDNYYLHLKFPPQAFFADVPMHYHFEQASQPDLFSAIHAIHEPLTPVFGTYTLAIRPALIPEHLRPKAYIGRCTANNQTINYGGEWQGDFLQTQVGSFGDYAVMVDTVPPEIQPENFHYNLSGQNSVSFKAKDNVGSAGTARGLRYRASIDNQWILTSYDLKYNRFTCHLPKDLSTGQHRLRLEITDDRGNTGVFDQTFQY